MFATADWTKDTKNNGSRELACDRRRFASFRWRFISIATLILVGFVVARQLEPDPAGFGTHRQLGLPECPTRAFAGQSCPTCGMTTSLAFLANGNFARAWQVRPAAVLMAFGAILTAAWSVACAWSGKVIGFENGDAALAWWAGGSFVIALTCWAIRWQQWADASVR